jgi:glycine/D-amino acid oxidase-like deaminating enzyme
MSFGPWVNPEAEILPDGEALPDRCDVVVIGGGLAGVSTALHLAEGGTDVVLLEAQPHVGLGASGRHLGHCDVGLLEHPHRTVSALGDERAAALFALCARNKDLLEGRGLLDRCGGLWAALDGREPDDIEQSAAALTRLGIPAEAIDADEAERKTGAYNLGPALWLPQDGRIDPWPALVSLAEAAEAAGALLLGQCAARVLPEADSRVRVAIGDHVLHAEAVVVAAGAQSGQVEPTLEHHITAVREQALLTEPCFAWYGGIPRAGHAYTSWRQQPDGHLLVSGCRWASPHLEVGEDDDTHISERIQTKIETFFRRALPAAEEIAVIDRWAWVFAVARDGLPLVGPLPGDPTRLVIAGTGATGAGMEFALGASVAQGLLTGESAVPDFLAANRLVRWR